MNIQKNEICQVPIWIQLVNLDLKYWGERALFKIIGQIGKPLQVDSFTRDRSRLAYPRIMVEVALDQNLVEEIRFMDENDDINIVGVKYEWKPVICAHCKGIGHEAKECKKKEPSKQEWIVKAPKEQKKVPEVDADGFVQVVKGSKLKGKEVVAEVQIANDFAVLDNFDGKEVMSGEGGGPSHQNG